MKYILFLMIMISGTVYGQSTYYIRADSVRFQKVGGNTTFILENATRGITNGILINPLANGRTAFADPLTFIPTFGWGKLGNASTVAGTNFIGTTDAVDFVIKTNGQEIARFSGDGIFRFQFGSSAVASGDQSIAMGPSAIASGDVSRSIGDATVASGSTSTALGSQTTASGDLSTSMGDATIASGANSTAIGAQTVASGVNSTSMGMLTRAKSFTGTVIGTFNDSTNATSPTSFNTANRVFEIGIGTADAARANAMTVLFNGNVGIGTLTPSATLDLVGTFQYVDGNQSNGFVLTSDASGNATWQAGGGGGGGLTIGDAITSGTATRVLFEGAGNVLAQDADFTFDGTRLTSSFRAPNGSATTPSYSFTNSTGTGLYFDGTYYAEAMGTVPIRNVFVISGASGLSQIDYPSPSAAALGDGKSFSTIALGDSWATSGAFEASSAVLGANSGLANGFNIVAGNAAGKIDFFAGGFAAGNHVMTIDPNLRVGIGVTAPLATLHLVGGFRYVDGAQGAGKVLVSDGDGDGTWTAQSALSVPISKLTAATALNSIENGDFFQEWNWNTLTSNNGLRLKSNSTTAASNAQQLFYVSTAGANANASQTTYGATIENVHTGTSSTNIGIQVGASGGTNNYAIIVPNGNVGIGTSTPATTLHVVGRFTSSQGADVASVNGAIALGADGNMFELTGTNAVTLISNVGWVNGSEAVLIFASTATLTDGTANSGTDIGMELAGNVNFVGSAGSVLTLVLIDVAGTQRWREKNRSVN